MSLLRYVGALALIGSTSAGANDALVAQTEIAGAAKEAATEIIAMEDERYRRMTVPVSINGSGPYQFMIDTGAQATVLSHDLADQLMLTERDTAMLVGMASSREVETTIVDEITFGSHSHYGARAALVTGENIGGADGILGIDALQDRRVLLDFENRTIEVAREGDRQSNRGFDIIVRARREAGRLIITRARVDGIRVAVIVDTGAQGSVGNEALFQRLRRSRESTVAEMTDINGVQRIGKVRMARSLELDRAKLSNFFLSFADSPTFAALGLDDEPALVLGMNELRLFERVAIDFPTRRVLFDLPDNARLPGPDRFSRLDR
jgi:predicted aspartyl protease